jgi:hypothetical protein
MKMIKAQLRPNKDPTSPFQMLAFFKKKKKKKLRVEEREL